MLFDSKNYDYKEDPKNFSFIKEGDVEDDGEFGYFKGYGSTFGGKPDSYGDVIVDGAFTDTIAKGGKFKLGIKMLKQHMWESPIGIYPDMGQNNTGLKLKGKIALKSTDGNDVYVLMKIGAINALSIGWEPLREDAAGRKVSIDEAIEYDDEKGIRLLKMIDLWEISPVTFPANDRAVITDVKSVIENAKTPTQMERALRDAGLSRSVAKYITSLCKHSLMNERTHYDKDLRVMLGKLKNVSDEIAIGGILNSLKSVNIPTVQCDAETGNNK